MRRSPLAPAAAFLCVLLLPLLAGADTGDCQSAIATIGRGLFAADAAALASCQGAVASGALPAGTDCAADAATRRRRDRAAKRMERLARVCTDADVATLALGGECDGATTVAALSACVRASHRAESERLLARAAGYDAVLPEAARTCATAALREARAYAAARLRLVQRCKGSAQRFDLAPGTECGSEARTVAWLEGRRAAAALRLSAACPPPALAATPFGAPCDAPANVDALAVCLFDAAAESADAVAAAEHPDLGFCGEAGPAVEQRIDALLAAMTLDEKILQMHGQGLAPLNHTEPIPRLGIPGLVMVDGPRGVGGAAGTATAFPVGMARAATWDPVLEERVGEAMGRELRAKGGSVLLAPTINVPRHPRWGRAQETYGEDPYLLSRIGVGFIRGVQQHVIASAKHFAVNSIEDTRFNVDVQLDERALREVYLPHFRAAVRDGHVASVMSAYNKVNGHYCAENPHLLADVLKGDWGFRGFVESDWVLGTRSTLPSLSAGLDIEMPSGVWYGTRLRTAALDGSAPMELIDGAVRRALRAQLCFRLDSDPPQVDPSQVSTAEHAALARQVARQAAVLLQNRDGVLPLDRGQITSLAVVGPLAAVANLGDVGSSSAVPATPPLTPLAAIQAAAGSIAVTHYPNGAATPEDAAAIAAADAVVVVAGLDSRDEGESVVAAGDRDSLLLPRQQDDLIAAVAAIAAPVIVVLEGSGPVTMPWLDQVGAVLMAWYPGQQGGEAIAELLFGDAAPSGRLPVVFPRAEADLPPFDNVSLVVNYDLFHGYRYLDRNGSEPLFPFGFGLTYTSFAYDDLRISPAVVAPDGRVRVSARVTNTGARAGAEVAQLYIGAQGSSVARAVRELKGFERLELAPGESRRVSFDVRAADLAIWDTAHDVWFVQPLTYRVEVGASSRDLPLHGSVRVAPN